MHFKGQHIRQQEQGDSHQVVPCRSPSFWPLWRWPTSSCSSRPTRRAHHGRRLCSAGCKVSACPVLPVSSSLASSCSPWSSLCGSHHVLLPLALRTGLVVCDERLPGQYPTPPLPMTPTRAHAWQLSQASACAAGVAPTNPGGCVSMGYWTDAWCQQHNCSPQYCTCKHHGRRYMMPVLHGDSQPSLHADMSNVCTT